MGKDFKIIKRNHDLIVRYRDRNSQFVINWLELLSWDADPFQDKIFHPEEDFMTGYTEQRKKLNLFILREQKTCFLLGTPGMGKTQLLSWMDYELSFEKRIKTKFLKAGKASLHVLKKKIIHALLPPKDRFLSFLYFRLGFRNLSSHLSQEVYKTPWLSWIPKGYIYLFHRPFISLEDQQIPLLLRTYLAQGPYVLLLDDAADLSEENIQFLSSLIEEDLSFQLIIADTPERIANSAWKKVTPALKMELTSLKEPELKEMLQKRIEACNGSGTYPLKEAQLKEIFKKANCNPQKVLQYARDAVIQCVLEKVRQKQDAPSSSSGIPDIPLQAGGGVQIEHVKPNIIPSDQKALSEYERKAQRSVVSLSQEFSSPKSVESYYEEEKDERKDVTSKEKIKKRPLSLKEKETEHVLASLAREFERKRR
ncbi:hypothetical protein J4410_01015 [Candidatus Woesearchaeota archaeon]|nr:hypothetical protein [Candidatus Woesearchaeota archaeon]